MNTSVYKIQKYSRNKIGMFEQHWLLTTESLTLSCRYTSEWSVLKNMFPMSAIKI